MAYSNRVCVEMYVTGEERSRSCREFPYTSLQYPDDDYPDDDLNRDSTENGVSNMKKKYKPDSDLILIDEMRIRHSKHAVGA